jgi:hypothetical protein
MGKKWDSIEGKNIAKLSFLGVAQKKYQFPKKSTNPKKMTGTF